MDESDAAFQRVLAERARRYGAPVQAATTGGEVGTFVGCRVGDTVLGFPVALVAEIAPLQRFTPLAGLRFARGLTHLRGDVMALVDVFAALTGQPARQGPWMLVLEGRDGRTAVPVEEFLGARLVREPDLLPAERAPELMRGITAATQDLWLLLDTATVKGFIDARGV
ncbi:MAG TPA: hypothetical protein DD490_13600 [Acidobacteria bacterium]|nr:hypothetical protein [Acidobacteriota bacterium]